VSVIVDPAQTPLGDAVVVITGEGLTFRQYKVEITELPPQEDKPLTV
jgi:hypothetical protein